MDEEDNVLFVRETTKEEEDDVWDDSALIKAYDRAVNLAKDEVAMRIGMETEATEENSSSQNHKKSKQGKTCRKWTIGSPCRAIYSTDGELYEAIITKINERSGTCIVTFVGYGNTEKVELSDLLESDGLQSQIEQQKSCLEPNGGQESPQEGNLNLDNARANGSLGEGMDYESEIPRIPKNLFNPGSSFNSSYGIMPPAPPLPPQLMSKLPDNDADALSSMLMSWYISGFHTGYYHGMKQARHTEERRKK